jgi:hypothetical protein
MLARMRETSYKRWSAAEWDKAARTVAFIRRHEAQMRAQADRYGSPHDLHYTRRRVIALLNWGRLPPGVEVEGLTR